MNRKTLGQTLSSTYHDLQPFRVAFFVDLSECRPVHGHERKVALFSAT